MMCVHLIMYVRWSPRRQGENEGIRADGRQPEIVWFFNIGDVAIMPASLQARWLMAALCMP